MRSTVQRVARVKKGRWTMKHIEVAWIEQILTFDDLHEVQSYLDELDSKGIQYSVIRREKLKLRIRKQYNKNTLLEKG